MKSSLLWAALALVVLGPLSGCKKPSDGGSESSSSADAARGVGGGGEITNAAAKDAQAEARLAAITNQFAAAQQAQAETIQRLLSRLEQLERQDSNHTASAQAVAQLRQVQVEEKNAFQEREKEFIARIKQLEGKVGAIEGGRVLPEIALTPEDGPTTKELDQKLRIAERNAELASEAAEAKAKEQPRFTVGTDGVKFSTADTNFVFRFGALLQVDSRSFFDDNPLLEGNDGFVLRRARPIFEGTLYRDFDFRIMPDFAGSSPQLYDAWINYRYSPALQLRAGKFKDPVGLERLQSASALSFNERGFVSDFVPTRDVGLSLWGDVFDGIFSYSVGLYNVTGDSRNASSSDFGDGKQFAGRVFVQPFKTAGIAPLQGLGFGVGGSYSQVNSNVAGLPSTTGGTLPGYYTAGQQQLFAYNPVFGTVAADGAQWRLSPQFTYTWGPFGLMGEYGITHQAVVNNFNARRADLEHTAWGLSAQWVLTGESASFSGITPRRPFKPGSGDWGAWQLVGRIGQLKLDELAFPTFANPETSASEATAWSVGLNWWLNKNVRLMMSYSQTMFDGGGAYDRLNYSTQVPPATVTAQDEKVFFTRLQVAF